MAALYFIWFKIIAMYIFFTTQTAGYVTCLLCNVALHRPTTSTSVYYTDAKNIDGNACNAVDGRISTNFWRGSCYRSVDNDLYPSLTVDLGDIYDIQYVDFSLREDKLQYEYYKKLSNIKIYVRNDTNSHSTVCGLYSGVPTEDDIGKGIIVNCSSLARYVRVKKLSADLQFCEMKVIANIPRASSCPNPPQSWYCRDLCYCVNGSNTCPQMFSVESTTNEPSLEPTTVMISSQPTPDDTSPESTGYDVSQEHELTGVSEVTNEINAITTEVSLVSTTQTMYLDVTKTKSSTEDIAMDDTFTQSTTNSQESSTQCVCPCSSGKNESELINYVNMLIGQIKIDIEETAIAKSRRTSALDNRGSAKAIGCVGIIAVVVPVLFLVVFDVVTFIKFISRN